MKRFLVVLLACVMLLSLFACAGKNSAAASASASAAKPLKVALCVSGPVNDGGFCQSAYEGLKLIEKTYGAEIAYTENLQTTDIEATFTDYAASGYNVIIGHGFQFGDPALAVAAKYPDTYFICTNATASADNVASYECGGKDGSYVTGALAAYMSKSGVIGFVAAQEGASQIKIVEGYKMGAKSVNPDIQVLYTFTGSFTDETLGKQAAEAMIAQGADVIGHAANQCGNGAILAAQSAGILATGNSGDQYELAPDTIMCSDIFNVDKMICAAVGTVVDGTFKGGYYEMGMADGIIEISPYHNFEDKIPADVKENISKLIASITDGSLKVPSVSELSD